MTGAFYGVDAPIFYCFSSGEPDFEKFAMVMFSMHGVRQGCTLGSFLFNLAMLSTYNTGSTPATSSTHSQMTCQPPSRHQ